MDWIMRSFDFWSKMLRIVFVWVGWGKMLFWMERVRVDLFWGGFSRLVEGFRVLRDGFGFSIFCFFVYRIILIII